MMSHQIENIYKYKLFLKNQIEILELKSTEVETKNSLDKLNKYLNWQKKESANLKTEKLRSSSLRKRKKK